MRRSIGTWTRSEIETSYRTQRQSTIFDCLSIVEISGERSETQWNISVRRLTTTCIDYCCASSRAFLQPGSLQRSRLFRSFSKRIRRLSKIYIYIYYRGERHVREALNAAGATDRWWCRVNCTAIINVDIQPERLINEQTRRVVCVRGRDGVRERVHEEEGAAYHSVS